MKLRVLGTVLVVLLLGPGSTGIAPAAAEDDIGGARAHYNKASRLYEVGEYPQALAEFKAAHLAKPDPAFLFNIAQCHRQLGDFEQAVVMYKRYLNASPKAANRNEVEHRVAELEASLAAKEAKSTREPPLVPPAGTAEPVVPVAPAQAETLPAKPISAPAVIAEAAAPSAQPAGSSLRYLRWVGVGVTLALAGGAIAAGLAASAKYDDLNRTCGGTSAGCSSSDIDTVKSRALAANVLWGATGVAAVATGLAFYLAPHSGGVQLAWGF